MVGYDPEMKHAFTLFLLLLEGSGSTKDKTIFAVMFGIAEPLAGKDGLWVINGLEPIATQVIDIKFDEYIAKLKVKK